MHNKVFISYALEDSQYAITLYDFLVENGFYPWMDKKDLLPGQNWNLMIQQALRNADFIILLLSKTSVNKRGYVQKEFNQAVTYCDEKLDSDIYIIPIKIDSCEIPHKLTKFQWIAYSSYDYQDRILQAINLQRSLMLKAEETKAHEVIGFESELKNFKGEYGEKKPRQMFDIMFPQFINTQNESLRELNVLITNDALEYVIRSRNNYFNYLKDIVIDPEDEGWQMNELNSTCNGGINFELVTKSFVSYTSFWSLYNTGAAHGNYWTVGKNYLVNPLRSFEIEQLFENFDLAILLLRDFIHDQLMKTAKEGGIEPEDFYLFGEELDAKRENFENFFFKKDKLVFIYNPYHLTAWSLGDHQPEISFKELLQLFPDEPKLHNFIASICKDSKWLHIK